MMGKRRNPKSLTKVLSGINQSPTKPLEEDLPFFLHVSQPPTHFQNTRIVSVDERQLVEIRSSSSDGQTPDSRWNLLTSRASLQVDLVLDHPGRGAPDLKSVPRALARPFPPSLFLSHNHQRQYLNMIQSSVGEMPDC